MTAKKKTTKKTMTLQQAIKSCKAISDERKKLRTAIRTAQENMSEFNKEDKTAANLLHAEADRLDGEASKLTDKAEELRELAYDAVD